MDIIIYTVLMAFIIALAAGYVGVPFLKRLKLSQQVRDDGPRSHLSKSGTPTMGGLIIMAAFTAAVFLFAQGGLDMIWFSVAVSLGFGFIGLLDDLIIVLRKRSLGLKAYQKIIGQLGIALIVAFFAYNNPSIGSKIIIPFTNIEWNLGVWYIPFTVFTVVAMVNAVNLTDGLDGLAAGVTLINTAAFTIIFYGLYKLNSVNGQMLAAANDSGMMVFSAAVTGACLGFLRFNTHPAKVFMGDTGSLSLGAALSVMAVVLRLQLLLVLTGMMFVLTTVSVVLQVGSYKLRKKRIFRMAPLHHHFELKGIPEPKIVASYYIITIVLCLVGILSVNF
ncbi:MAG: phospho-N-acetylmuramoyl-pentapeptide-transferase [Christensenellales bacterium]